MWRLAIAVTVACAVVLATPPHHHLLESSNKDVRRFGELVNELVELFEKVTGKQAVDEAPDNLNVIGPSIDADLKSKGLLSQSLLQKISTHKPLLYQKLQNKFTTTVAPGMTSTTQSTTRSTSQSAAITTSAPTTLRDDARR